MHVHHALLAQPMLLKTMPLVLILPVMPLYVVLMRRLQAMHVHHALLAQPM
jgi:hypothetical protein